MKSNSENWNETLDNQCIVKDAHKIFLSLITTYDNFKKLILDYEYEAYTFHCTILSLSHPDLYKMAKFNIITQK